MNPLLQVMGTSTVNLSAFCIKQGFLRCPAVAAQPVNFGSVATAQNQRQAKNAQHQIISRHRNKPYRRISNPHNDAEQYIKEIHGHSPTDTNAAAKRKVIYISAAERRTVYQPHNACPYIPYQPWKRQNNNSQTVRRQPVNRVLRRTVILPCDENINKSGKKQWEAPKTAPIWAGAGVYLKSQATFSRLISR